MHRAASGKQNDRRMKRAPVANRLIAALPRTDRLHLLASCERVDLTSADVLWDAADRVRHVYFPVSGFISLWVPVYGRANLGAELIGNEGMLGASLVLGVNAAPLQALVQGAGTALRMSAARFRRELVASRGLQRGMNRYICVVMAQLVQSTACVHFHGLDARVARWLLMTHDRAHSSEFNLTHESLAQMLGVRRVGVTKAAGLLRERKLVSYKRGNITILDRLGLESASCECYQAAIDTYARILG